MKAIENSFFFFCLMAVIWMTYFMTSSFAHEKRLHEEKQETPETQKTSRIGEEQIVYTSINKFYLREVKPIFQNSCFNCHSSQTQFPWYHSLPLVKGLLDSDVQEAKKHLDFSNGFPFQGHGTPREDLEAIAKSVSEGTMPPFRYRMLHWGSGLTKEEREKILNWIQESQRKLDSKQTEKN